MVHPAVVDLGSPHSVTSATKRVGKPGTPALGLYKLHSHPIQVEHDPGPWKPSVVIFQATNILDGARGVPLPSLTHPGLLLPAQDTSAHAKGWPAGAQEALACFMTSS